MNALKYKPEDENIMRDLSMLQVHCRDFEGYMETRRQLLLTKPEWTPYWVVYASACFIGKQYKNTLECIQSIFKFDTEEVK